MNRSIKKILLCLIVFFLIALPILHINAADQTDPPATGLDKAREGLIDSANPAGLTTHLKVEDAVKDAKAGKDDLRETIIKIVGYILSFMGIILLMNLIFAGFSWMNSNGNEESIKKAKDKITSSIIGLAIVLGAYVVTSLVFEILNMTIAT